MTEKKNNDFMRLLDLRVKPEDDKLILRADWIPDQARDDRKRRKDDRGGESGRSMVEMLGVLAIVGVLSVGGIAGYTYAMNRYYANELIMGASERAVVVSAQIASGQKPSLREFDGIETAGGVFSGDVADDIADGFGIAVSKVKGAVCENLKKMVDGTEVFIANDDTDLTEVTCSTDNNAFMFVFKMENGGGNNSFEHCPEYGACVTCSANQEVRCSGWDEHCVCVDPSKPKSWACGDAKCISDCSDDTHAECSSYFNCLCIPNDAEDDDWICQKDGCCYCSDGEPHVDAGDCWCE